MSTALINNELEVAYPDGFQEMSEAELHAAYKNEYKNIWGIRDTERHIIFTILWHDSHAKLLKVFDAESIAKRDEKIIAKGMKKLGYRSLGFFKTSLAGQEAHGFRYQYTNMGVGQDGEAFVFTQGKVAYKVYYYTRPELVETNRPIRDAMLMSLKLK